jgi:hypothetical protein
MKIFLIFAFFVFSLISCSEISTDSPSFKDHMEEFANELTAVPHSVDNFITFFPNLRYLFSCFKILIANDPYSEISDEISQMEWILLEYCTMCQNYFTESLIESLRAVRLYGNVELTYLFLFYVKTVDSGYSFNDLKRPLEKILKYNDADLCFEVLKFIICDYYGLIANEILSKPFVATCQDQAISKNGPNITPPTKYKAALDWEERKKILKEIAFSLRDMSEMSKTLVGWHLFLMKKIKYEFIIREFQVGRNGPRFDHARYIFYRLQSLLEPRDSYKSMDEVTKNLLPLFRIYYIHRDQWQFIDPILIPKPMLAIISQNELKKKEIFELFKLPVEVLLKKAVESLETNQIMNLSLQAKLQKISYQSAMNRELAFRPLLLHNLMNLKNVFPSKGEWILKCYFALKN